MGKKKSRNISGQKIKQPFGTENHATSGDEKIMQPLGTKKSLNLSGQQKKSHNLSGHNHAQQDKIRYKHRSTRSWLGPLVLFYSACTAIQMVFYLIWKQCEKNSVVQYKKYLNVM